MYAFFEFVDQRSAVRFSISLEKLKVITNKARVNNFAELGARGQLRLLDFLIKKT